MAGFNTLDEVENSFLQAAWSGYKTSYAHRYSASNSLKFVFEVFGIDRSRLPIDLVCEAFISSFSDEEKYEREHDLGVIIPNLDNIIAEKNAEYSRYSTQFIFPEILTRGISAQCPVVPDGI